MQPIFYKYIYEQYGTIQVEYKNINIRYYEAHMKFFFVFDDNNIKIVELYESLLFKRQYDCSI